MRRCFPVIVLTVLLTAACGSNSSGDESTAESSDASHESTVGTAPDTNEVERSNNTVDSEGAGASCGFDAGLTADRVVVEQIPGEGRQDTPSALSNPQNESFDEPLVDLDRILSGGPPPDGIPPIDNPVFQTASTVDWLRCNEPVLSLSVNGETRAYPVQIMTWHELVNDTFGSVPVTVSYCPLCNSALAYRRDLEDRVVTFGTSGRLYNSSLVMYDRETESLWTHFDGTAVAGELVGTKLELLPMQTLSWESFLEANPDGLVLSRETGFSRSYGQNPYPGYDDVTTSPFLFDGEADPRLAAKERVVAIRRAGDSVAVVLEHLAEQGVVETEVGGDELTVWHLPGVATALETSLVADGRDVGAVGVYIPQIDGRRLTFDRDGDVFVDARTGSEWNIQGLAIAGEFEGEQLRRVEHLDTFWFALAAFEPDTRVLGG